MSMSPLPDPPLGRDEWIVLALRTLISWVRLLNQNQETLAMSMSDLSAAQDRSEASTGQALAAIATEIQQLRDAVTALSESATPQQITAFKARMNSNTDRLDAAVTAMRADDEPAAPAEPTA